MSGQATVAIGDKTWQVALATTNQERVQGLGGLASIPANTGMLFVMDTVAVQGVTMSPMLFPLDVLFLGPDPDANQGIDETSGMPVWPLVVSDVALNAQPGQEFASDIPVQLFLEVNAGEASGVSVGDRLRVNVTELPAQSGGFDLGSAMTLLLEMSLLTWGMVGMMKQLFPSKEEVFKVLPTRKELRSLLPQTVPAKLKPAGPEAEALMAPGRIPARDKALRKLGVHTVVEVHDDGDLTVRRQGELYVVTTEGDIFKQAEWQARTMPKNHLGEGNGREKMRRHQQMMGESSRMDYMPDSPEWLAFTIEDIGYRDKLDNTFQAAIDRCRDMR